MTDDQRSSSDERNITDQNAVTSTMTKGERIRSTTAMNEITLRTMTGKEVKEVTWIGRGTTTPGTSLSKFV